MIRKFEDVPFDQIAWSSTDSRVTWRRVPPLLRLSVREVGVLNPLIVTETALPDRYSIVTGWLRFQAAREVGETSVPCHIYRNFPPKILLLISIFDNLGHRRLNIIEQGMVLSKLSEYYSTEEIHRTFIPVLGLHHLGKNWKPVVDLTELHEDLQWAIAEGQLAPDAARALAPMPLGHSQHVLRLLCTLPAHPATQTDIARGFCDLLDKTETSPLELIQDEGWADMLPYKANPDTDLRAEEDLLKLEIDLAAPPALFARRRKISGAVTGRNVLAPGEKVSAAQPRKKGGKGKGCAGPVCTAEEITYVLKRRLGMKMKKPTASDVLPEGTRLSTARSTGNQRLEVSFSTPSELRSILQDVLDAEERGALQAVLGRA